MTIARCIITTNWPLHTEPENKPERNYLVNFRRLKGPLPKCRYSIQRICRNFVSMLLQFVYTHLHRIESGDSTVVERRTRGRKVAGSRPGRSGGRIFISRINILCWLLFRWPFHSRVTAVARKRFRSFCQKRRWQITAKHTCTLRMWLRMNEVNL